MRRAVCGEPAEGDEFDVRLAVQQIREAREDAEGVGTVQAHQDQPRPACPDPPHEPGEAEVGRLGVRGHRVADRDRVRPDRAAQRGAARGEEQRRQLADDPPVGLLRERAEQVVRRDPGLQVHHRDLPPEGDLCGDDRGHPPAVHHDRGRVEIHEQVVEPGEQHGGDGRGVRAERLTQQHRDVDGHSERLVRLVDRHRVAARCDGDRADAADGLERPGDGGEAGDLRTAAGHKQDVVVVVVFDVQRVFGRLVELGHGCALRDPGPSGWEARSVCGSDHRKSTVSVTDGSRDAVNGSSDRGNETVEVDHPE